MYLVILSSNINLRSLHLTQQKLTNTMCYMKKVPNIHIKLNYVCLPMLGNREPVRKELCTLSDSLNFTSHYLKTNLFNGKMKKDMY